MIQIIHAFGEPAFTHILTLRYKNDSLFMF